MAQHIGVKTLNSNIEYKGNFADIYNLLGTDYQKFNLINSINIYGDTIIKKEKIVDLKKELEILKKENNKKINNFISFIEEQNDDLIFIGD